ncbi:MAG: mucoidy inhibitor MuiA family protein [bacterium]|nr:mucoidy inhibitor MuiA family protein [bacterium]
MKKTTSILFCILSVMIQAGFLYSQAREVKISPKIKSVTVYRNRAIVTRKFNTAVEKGRYSFVFQHLPLSLENRSIRVTGKGTAAAAILDIQVRNETISHPFQEKVGQLENGIKDIKDKEDVINDHLSTLKKRKEFLKNFLNQTLEAMTAKEKKTSYSMVQLKEMLDFQEKEVKAAFQKEREYRAQLKKYSKQRGLLETEISRYSNERSRREKALKVDMEIKNSGDLNISFSYMIPGASWSPNYDLRVDSGNKRAELTYSALVEQNTGEDWNNVRLALSTTQPMEVKEITALEPMFLNAVILGNCALGGTIALADGNVIPGVAVEIWGNGIRRRTAVSNESGKYQFVNLTPGYYTISAELEGFKDVIRKGLRVQKGKFSVVDIRMEMGSIKEEIAITWSLKLKPGEKKDISVKYTVVYPENLLVEQVEMD